MSSRARRSALQRARGTGRHRMHPHVDALVWHPHLLDRSMQTAEVLRARGDRRVTERDCLTWLLDAIERGSW